jgi:hypothetical protein
MGPKGQKGVKKSSGWVPLWSRKSRVEQSLQNHDRVVLVYSGLKCSLFGWLYYENNSSNNKGNDRSWKIAFVTFMESVFIQFSFMAA